MWDCSNCHPDRSRGTLCSSCGTKNNCHPERSRGTLRLASNCHPERSASECPRAVEGPCAAHVGTAAPGCPVERSSTAHAGPKIYCHPERSASECPRAVEGPCARHPIVIPSEAEG